MRLTSLPAESVAGACSRQACKLPNLEAETEQDSCARAVAVDKPACGGRGWLALAPDQHVGDQVLRLNRNSIHLQKQSTNPASCSRNAVPKQRLQLEGPQGLRWGLVEVRGALEAAPAGVTACKSDAHMDIASLSNCKMRPWRSNCQRVLVARLFECNAQQLKLGETQTCVAHQSGFQAL